MGATESGPLVLLTAEAPSADFMVSVCYSGRRLAEANMGYSAVARTSSPGFETGPDVVLESSGASVVGEEEGFDSSQGVLGTTLDVTLGDDDDAFVDTTSNCTEQTMVHMGVDGPFEPGQAIEFEWDVSVLMRYEHASRVSLRDRELEIRIEAI